MKLAISNIAWTDEDDREMYNFLKESKISSLEIAPTRFIQENPYDHIDKAVEIKDNLKQEYGLDVVSMQSIWFGRTEKIFENVDDFNAMIAYTKKCIDFANAIGCSNIVFGCPKNRNVQSDADYEKALDFFRILGAYAQVKNVVIAVEPNPTIYNTNFLNRTKEALDFVKKVASSHVKINYDLGTVIENGEELTLLKDNLEWINHIHISEPNLEPIKSRELHKELITILKENAYDKTISIEMKKADTEIVKNTILYVKGLIGE